MQPQKGGLVLKRDLAFKSMQEVIKMDVGIAEVKMTEAKEVLCEVEDDIEFDILVEEPIVL